MVLEGASDSEMISLIRDLLLGPEAFYYLKRLPGPGSPVSGVHSEGLTGEIPPSYSDTKDQPTAANHVQGGQPALLPLSGCVGREGKFR